MVCKKLLWNESKLFWSCSLWKEVLLSSTSITKKQYMSNFTCYAVKNGGACTSTSSSLVFSKNIRNRSQWCVRSCFWINRSWFEAVHYASRDSLPLGSTVVLCAVYHNITWWTAVLIHSYAVKKWGNQKVRWKKLLISFGVWAIRDPYHIQISVVKALVLMWKEVLLSFITKKRYVNSFICYAVKKMGESKSGVKKAVNQLPKVGLQLFNIPILKNTALKCDTIICIFSIHVFEYR